MRLTSKRSSKLPDSKEYRRAALGLATAARQSRYRAAILSSATGREGTTSAAVNIGLHLMEDCGLNPLLIEVNRVRPSLTRIFELDDQKSLAALVSGGGSAMQYVQRTPTGLSVIPAGPANSGSVPVSRLESTLCHAVQELQNSFDFILLDTPAILESSDVMIAGRVVPQLVLVVGAGQSSQESLSRACQELKEARITLIGTILNSRKRIIPGWIDRYLQH